MPGRSGVRDARWSACRTFSLIESGLAGDASSLDRYRSSGAETIGSAAVGFEQSSMKQSSMRTLHPVEA